MSDYCGAYQHKCRKEGKHIEGDCECTYGASIEHHHDQWHIDPRCRELRQKRRQDIMDNAAKSWKWYPQHMRGPGEKPNAQDKLPSACWNLTDKQILEVVKYVKENYGL
mgnify:CR=1 FL=1